jgi:cytoskeletal protein CcmA (bactofilin family)
MAYEVKFTDNANKGSIFVDDNTINQETSLGLPGRNASAYGTTIAENFLHLLENFANSTEPANPIEGQLWYDTSPGVDQLKVYDGTAWAAAGGLKKATSEPDVANSVTGDLWVDTNNQQLYLYSGSGWVLVGPSFSDGLNTGATPGKITGANNVDYTILRIDIEAEPVVIIAVNEFTPKSTIPGFSVIKPGINVSTRNIAGAGIGKLIGTAERAESLVVGNTPVPAANFLRSDQISTTNFAIRVRNNSGIQLGSGSQLSLGVEGETGVLSHATSGAQFSIRVNDGGISKTVITVDGTSVGINNSAPDQALDVIGNIQTDSNLLVDGITQSDTFGTGAVIVKGGIGVAKNLNVGGNIRVIGNLTSTNITPDLNNQRNLGTPLLKWQNIYSTTFHGNVIGNVTGTISGKSSSTDKLASSTNFQMTGDVSAPTFTFDGQTGGATKTFNTTISNSFISTKTLSASSFSDDELLVKDLKIKDVPEMSKDEYEEFIKILTYSTPRMFEYFGFAKSVWELVFDSVHLQVKKNKKNVLEPKGYFYFFDKKENKLYVWEFENKPAAKGSPENVVLTNLIYSDQKNELTIPKIINNFSKWNIENKTKLPVFEMISRGEFPINETLLPMFKRKLIAYVNQKQTLENYYKQKESLNV